jgi:hypothetical protein
MIEGLDFLVDMAFAVSLGSLVLGVGAHAGRAGARMAMPGPPPSRGGCGAQGGQQEDGTKAREQSLHRDLPLQDFLAWGSEGALLYEGTLFPEEHGAGDLGGQPCYRFRGCSVNER